MISILLLTAAALAASPDRDGHVTDLPDLIPPEVEESLEARLAGYREATGFDVAVLVVPSIGHENELDYATAVRKDWELGGEGRHGALFLVVPPPDKLMAIATGPGARPYLTDAEVIRIKDEVVRPMNREERRVDAIVAGVDAMLAELGDQPAWERTPPERPAPAPTHHSATSDEDVTGFLCVIGVIAACFVLFIFWLFWPKSRRHYGGGGYYGGRSSGGSGGGSYHHTTVYVDHGTYSGGYDGGGGGGGSGGGSDGGGGGGGSSD